MVLLFLESTQKWRDNIILQRLHRVSVTLEKASFKNPYVKNIFQHEFSVEGVLSDYSLCFAFER